MIKALVVLATLVLPFTVRADDAKADPLTVDLAPALEFYGPSVKTVRGTIVLWHWFNSNRRDPVWKTNFPADHQAGIDHAANLAHKFFDALCPQDPAPHPADCQALPPTDNSRFNMYGPGLYLSTDPVATADYGGGDGWVLEQIRLPQGLRYLDIGLQGSYQLPSGPAADKLTALFQSVGCNSTYVPSPEEIIRPSSGLYSGATPSCRLFVRRLLKDGLKIEGFYYTYTGTKFRGCDDQARGAAFVLIDGRRLRHSNVRIFNSQSRDERKDRLRIQSFFYKASAEDERVNTNAYLQRNQSQLQQQFPGASIGSGSTCTNGVCRSTIFVCRPQPSGSTNCLEDSSIKIPLGVYPTNITKDQIPLSQNISSEKLLWDDLEGEMTDATLDSWSGRRLRGCKALVNPAPSTP